MPAQRPRHACARPAPCPRHARASVLFPFGIRAKPRGMRCRSKRKKNVKGFPRRLFGAKTTCTRKSFRPGGAGPRSKVERHDWLRSNVGHRRGAPRGQGRDTHTHVQHVPVAAPPNREKTPVPAGVANGKLSFESEGSAPHQAPPPPGRARCRRREGGRRKAHGGRSVASRRLGATAAGGRADGCPGVRGGGVGIPGFPGAHPGAQIRASRRASAPHGARPGRAEGADGTGGWSSFPTTVSGHSPVPSWRKRGPGTWIQKECTFYFFWHFDRGITYKIRVFGSFAIFTICHGWEQEPWESRPFASRSGPPHACAPGAQMIRMASGSSLAFQRLSRDTPPFILSVRLAETREHREASRASVTESRSVRCDVGGHPGGPSRLSPDPLPPPTQPQRKNSTTSMLALDVVRKRRVPVIFEPTKESLPHWPHPLVDSGAARGESGAVRGESGAARGESGAVRGESGAVRGESGAARGESGVVQRLFGRIRF
eukprot:gene16986-biopygen9829